MPATGQTFASVGLAAGRLLLLLLLWPPPQPLALPNISFPLDLSKQRFLLWLRSLQYVASHPFPRHHFHNHLQTLVHLLV